MFGKVELLAPAGDTECFDSALKFGADAIYLAGTEFGMRTASKNFTPEQLTEAVKKAHEKGVKVHVTCNTLPRNEEIDRLRLRAVSNLLSVIWYIAIIVRKSLNCTISSSFKS